MSIWLKLTWYDGTPFRIDIDKCESYQPTIENNAKTSITVNAEAYHVKEPIEEIDAAIGNPNHPLRIGAKTGGWS